MNLLGSFLRKNMSNVKACYCGFEVDYINYIYEEQRVQNVMQFFRERNIRLD